MLEKVHTRTVAAAFLFANDLATPAPLCSGIIILRKWSQPPENVSFVSEEKNGPFRMGEESGSSHA